MLEETVAFSGGVGRVMYDSLSLEHVVPLKTKITECNTTINKLLPKKRLQSGTGQAGGQKCQSN